MWPNSSNIQISEHEWPFKRLIPVHRSLRLSLSLAGADGLEIGLL